jgi:hypothetical protein
MTQELNYSSANVTFKNNEPLSNSKITKRIYTSNNYQRHSPSVATNILDVEQDKMGNEVCSLVSVTYSYHNESNRDITIVTRDSLRLVLPALSENKIVTMYNSSMVTDKLIIQKKITIHNSKVQQVRDYLNLAEHSDPNLLVIMNAVNQAYNTFTSNQNKASYFNKRNEFDFVIYVQHEVTIAQLQGMEDCFYHIPSDLLISLKPLKQTSAHPFSRSAVSSIKPPESISGVGIDYVIIDNDSLISSRFVLLSGEVYKISPKVDKTRDNGVYVSRYKYDARTSTKVNHSIEHFELNEFDEKLGLFKTYEEALTCGNVAKSLEKDLLDTKINLKNKDLELERLRQEIEQKNLFNKDILNDKEHERKDKSLSRDEFIESLRAHHEREKFDLNARLDKQRAENESKKAVADNIKTALTAMVVIAGGLLAIAKWYKSSS